MHTDPTLPAKTVQQYIDERPIWADGTPAPVAPLTRMQWRIWALATAGKFFEGLIVFMTGVALPLIVEEFALGPVGKGLVSAASLLGILVGATALGGLSDHWGRKRIFIIEMFLFAACLTGLCLSPNVACMIAFLFGTGVALGCDYPTAHLVISESIPTAHRGRLVLGAFAFQAVGALVGTAVGYVILYENPHLGAWRWMYASAVVPAVLVVAGRFFITDSGHWLVSRGRLEQAERETRRLLFRDPPYPSEIRLAAPVGAAPHENAGGYRALLAKGNRRALILSAVPWFLQDLGTYGIGIFTPTILASTLGAQSDHPRNLAELIHNDMLAAKGAAVIDLLLLAGIVCAVLLVDKLGRMRLQILGFLGAAAGLLLASFSLDASGRSQMLLLFSGFMLFSFMTNVGPNAMTYLVAGEVFPTAVRGKGAGLAASIAKVGAVLTAFLFPVLLKDLGTVHLLYALVGTSILGAVVTWIFRIETKGVSLETIGQDGS